MVQRIYLSFDHKTDHIDIDKKIAHYLIKVLRLKNNDIVKIFNGIDGEFEASLKLTEGKANLLKQKKTKDFYQPPYLQLCYAPTKNVKADFIAKKSAELGITHLQPMITEFSIIKKVNIEKLNLSMIEGIEQTGRNDLIQISPIEKLQKLLANNHDKIILFFDEAENGKTPIELASIFKDLIHQKIMIFIGPEGGFSSNERKLFDLHPQVINISLGKRILRTDSAIIAASTIANSFINNWQ